MRVGVDHLVRPPPKDGQTRERVQVLREDIGETLHRAALLDVHEAL